MGPLLLPLLILPLSLTPHPPRRSLSLPTRVRPINAKITGAALAAAFASKGKGPAEEAELTLAEKEERVIESIRRGVNAGLGRPGKVLSALGDFGQASGALAQTWLTPAELERCASFWGGGSTLLVRDLRRRRLGLSDLKASPYFGLLALNTFPWTPLLVPLVARAVNDTSGSSTFIPRSFSERRLAALQRLRDDAGLASSSNPDFRSPQNIDEGLRFLSDGTRLLLRDFRRGRLLDYGDTYAAYGWFLFLSFSTFPLTPLLLPVIDKRRDGVQSDYVTSQFRARRLAAFARYRASLVAPPRTPTEIVRAAASPDARPAPAELLAAIVALAPVDRGTYFDALAGGGSPGRRWKLLYTAGKDAVVAARTRQKSRVACVDGYGRLQVAEASWIDEVGEVVFPWTRFKGGLYVDQWVTAIQRFDASTGENENGVFGVLGAEWLQFSVKGPFKWPQPERRTVCAFQPTSTRCKLGPLDWEWAMEPDAAAGALPFEQVRPTQLPFFKFLLVDDVVAVAQGRSGGVAVWVREG